MNDIKNKTSAIYRADGVTAAERYLKKLCDRTFLSLWSYSGIYRDQGNGKMGEGKEVCDLLVVFQNHIIIFSDKDCAFPNSGNLELDWSRWFRRAVLKSAEQIWGAERWIKSYPNRLFLDRACTQPFPIELPSLATANFHRIVVAHDASRKCKEKLGGSGSLMIAPSVVGSMHYDQTKDQIKPFTIGQVDPSKGFVHVFDDTSLDIIMNALDTITDFVEYLLKKESFISSGKLGWAAGEEDLLAFYLRELNKAGEHDFVLPSDIHKVDIKVGQWEDFSKHPQRLAQIDANRVSYAWDELIETFSGHIFAGTSYTISHPGIGDQEKLFRLFVREPRTRRRILARSLLELIEKTPRDQRATRVMLPSQEGEPYYVFLLLPEIKGMSYSDYRELRRNLLSACCKVVKLKFPKAQDILGIATETGINENGSQDAVYFDAREWTDEDQDEARSLQEDIGLLVNVNQFASKELEYPELKIIHPFSSKSTQNRIMKGRDRNMPCPCGSKRKYKKCCGK